MINYVSQLWINKNKYVLDDHSKVRNWVASLRKFHQIQKRACKFNLIFTKLCILNVISELLAKQFAEKKKQLNNKESNHHDMIFISDKPLFNVDLLHFSSLLSYEQTERQLWSFDAWVDVWEWVWDWFWSVIMYSNRILPLPLPLDAPLDAQRVYTLKNESSLHAIYPLPLKICNFIRLFLSRIHRK